MYACKHFLEFERIIRESRDLGPVIKISVYTSAFRQSRSGAGDKTRAWTIGSHTSL